ERKNTVVSMQRTTVTKKHATVSPAKPTPSLSPIKMSNNKQFEIGDVIVIPPLRPHADSPVPEFITGECSEEDEDADEQVSTKWIFIPTSYSSFSKVMAAYSPAGSDSSPSRQSSVPLPFQISNNVFPILPTIKNIDFSHYYSDIDQFG
ncbi:hypothetical protein PFISCL1PPCAC_9828, partial [Pristionchus fissidentatus]